MPRPRTAGLVYDVFDRYVPRPGDPPDADAEFEPWATVDALDAAFRRLGFDVVRVGHAHDLLDRLPGLHLDVALSIAEGNGATPNRESYAPTLFEMAGVPYLGADALTLAAALDKAWTKTLVAAAGVPVAPGVAVPSADALDGLFDRLPPFPLFVKPRFEGSSKGVLPESRVEDADALRRQVAFVTETYRQDALVEAFVPGAEFTVAVVGHGPPRALPVLQRAVEARTGIGLHALERRGRPAEDHAYHLEPRVLTPALEARLQADALTSFEVLRCRDFARMDFRVPPGGAPVFLEANPLPTFAPDGTFAILAELLGQPYDGFLADVHGEGLARLGLRGEPRREDVGDGGS